jgi:acyl-coenzyme A synthetase/AMP-(fatty) acid ligase
MKMSGRTPSQPLGPSGHVDDFARRNLPPSEQWPDLLLDRSEFQYPEYLNAAVELTDRIVEKGWGDRIALIGNGRQRTYKELADWSNRLAHALVENYGVKPGNRVLIRSGNNPALVAAWLAATKAGAVVVNTMPMLRAGELSKIIDKAEIALALTDSRIADELVACAKTSKFLKQVVNFDGTSNHDAELDRVALNKPVKFDAVKTGRDGWNLTGDSFVRDATGRLSFVARSDDMIVSSGYNIAGPEVEAALLSHPVVAECGVVGAPDEARGMIVKAYVVLTGGAKGDAALTQALQDHVKQTIAPYKYPRAIEYVAQLPKTETGKLRRFALRQMAAGGPASPSIAAE